MGKLRKWTYPHFCLVCGVDSGPIRTFIFFFMGSLILAATMILVWAWITRRLGATENYSSLAIEAERRDCADISNK